jgi:hypothetical protein
VVRFCLGHLPGHRCPGCVPQPFDRCRVQSVARLRQRLNVISNFVQRERESGGVSPREALFDGRKPIIQPSQRTCSPSPLCGLGIEARA